MLTTAPPCGRRSTTSGSAASSRSRIRSPSAGGSPHVRLTADDRLRLAKRHTGSVEAHHWYLKGRYHWNRRTEDGLRRAIECFNEAIAADPNDALAYVGLADSYTLPGTVTYGAFYRRDVWPRARAAAAKALELDEQLAEAHTSLAFIKFRYDWDWDGAERGFARAIELNPHYATARQWYAVFLPHAAITMRRLREIRCAQELDPLSLPIATGVGRFLYLAGRHDEAVVECRKAIEMDGTFAGAHIDLGLIYVQLGRADEAISEFQRAVDLSGGSHIPLVHLGHAYRRFRPARPRQRDPERGVHGCPLRSMSPLLIGPSST